MRVAGREKRSLSSFPDFIVSGDFIFLLCTLVLVRSEEEDKEGEQFTNDFS